MRMPSAKKVLGGYELIERLSRGETHEVWKAWHVALARPAAVKVLFHQEDLRANDQLADAVRRLVCEAQLTASLRSPHVAQVHELAVVDDAAVYFALEFLDGMNTGRFVYRFGALPPQRAVHWLHQVCHALGEVHARGLIHGDVKPSNVFVSRRGVCADHITLLDFGLARVSQQAASPDSTKHSSRPGTPGFMAPEQLLGAAGDSRADVYAMGCLAYFLLTGRGPFDAKDDERLAQMHVSSTPPSPQPPADRRLPAFLEALVMSCLSKEPRERPSDAQAVRAELSSGMERNLWSEMEAQSWWEQHFVEG